jgi:TolB-like protein
MKKLFLFGILVLIAGVFAYSQETITLSLDKAISASAETIEQDIGAKKKAAILNFISPSPELSTYVIDELMDVFTKHKKLDVTERTRMDAIRRERNYQTSGEVSDAEIKSIGNQLGADYVITGELKYLGEVYRFRVYAIDIESGMRVASTTKDVPKKDKRLRFFLNEDGKVVSSTGQAQKKPVEFSLGLGGFGKFWFEEPDSDEKPKYLDFGGYANLNLEIYSWILFDASFYFINKGILDNKDNFNLNGYGISFSSFVKMPTPFFFLFGFEYDMKLYTKDSEGNESKREDLEKEGSLYIKAGAGFDVNIDKHFRFSVKALYNLFLVDGNRRISKDLYIQGPSLLIGFRYVF